MVFNTKQIGIFSGVLAAFLWSTTYISGRFLLKGDGVIDPWSLSAIRLAIGGGTIFIIAYSIDRKKLFSFSYPQLGILAIFSQFSYVGMSFFLFKGQQYSNAINSALIFALVPVLISFLIDLRNRRINHRRNIGLSIATAGCLLVIGVIGISGVSYSTAGIKGDLFTVMSAICWIAGALIGGRVIKKGYSFAATAWTLLFGAITMLLVMLIRWNGNTIPHDSSSWLIIVYVGLLPSGVAFLAWNIALSRISLTLLNTIQYLSPGFTIILAFLILHEKVTALNLLGVFLITIGLTIMEINYNQLFKKNNPR